MRNQCRSQSSERENGESDPLLERESLERNGCLERGYGGVLTQNDKDDAKKRPRRKRPLKLNTPEKKNDELDQ